MPAKILLSEFLAYEFCIFCLIAFFFANMFAIRASAPTAQSLSAMSWSTPLEARVPPPATLGDYCSGGPDWLGKRRALSKSGYPYLEKESARKALCEIIRCRLFVPPTHKSGLQ
jgi:hypothetical protein